MAVEIRRNSGRNKGNSNDENQNMERLILTINKLQQLKAKYDVPEIQLPQIIVVGSQSSGKSSVLERIIGYDILPKASTVATRCPIVLQLINDPTMNGQLRAEFMDNFVNVSGSDKIAEMLQSKTEQIGKSQDGVSSKPITFQLYGSTYPTLTLIDLPGLIKNDGELPRGSTEKIMALNEEYAQSSHSIILAISAANVDLANSDAIHMARKHDSIGRRTVNVITKIDLMDRGTTIAHILKSNLLKSGIGAICVVNRSQENVNKRLSISEANTYELEFIDSKRPDISGDHGIDILVNVLVHKLENEILINLPSIQDIIAKRLKCLAGEIEVDSNAINNKEIIINSTIVTFIDEYKKMLKGEREQYLDTIMGGSKISIVLYDEFTKDIDNFRVTKKSEEELLVLLRNTAGHRRMSYSIENAFICIIREEVNKFVKVCFTCNDKIKVLLRELVVEVIKEFNLDKYTNLALRIEKEMYEFIEQRYTFTEMIIDNIIQCEKEDIFCVRPNTNMFEKPDAKYEKKVYQSKTNTFKDNIKTVSTHFNIPLPPLVYQLLINEHNTKNLITLMEEITKCQEAENQSSNKVATQRTQTSKFNVITPPILTEMISKVTENQAEAKETLTFLQKEKQLPLMIKTIMEKSMTSDVVEAGDNNPNVTALQEMVIDYFNDIKLNIKTNVPKWIQTVFIKYILKNIDGALNCIRLERDLESLLDVSSEELHRLNRKEDELRELESIAIELEHIRRRT